MSENLIQDSSGTPLSDWQRSNRLAHTPWVDARQLCPPGSRLVVVAPHPDDEILMCGGLLSDFRGREHELLMISVTDGEGSHPASAHWSPQRLREQRPLESRAALQRLGLDVDAIGWQRLSLQDSAVGEDESLLFNHLCQLLTPDDRLLTTWRDDGHCDHEAVGRACADAAKACQAHLLEVPVWAWHWASPEDPRLPWSRARRLELDQDSQQRKRDAIAAHVSQIQSDAGQPPVLSTAILQCLLQPFELVFV